MWPFKKKEPVINSDLSKKEEPETASDLSKKEEPETAFDTSIFDAAPQYKVGAPILHTGVKFYPVFEKTEYWNVYSAIKGVIKCYPKYEKIVEYFTAKENAEKFIATPPQAQEE